MKWIILYIEWTIVVTGSGGQLNMKRVWCCTVASTSLGLSRSDGITEDISRDGITGYLKGWDN